MKRRYQVCLSLLMVLGSPLALAHDQTLVAGFYGGVLHPLTGLDHLAALVLAGFVIGRMRTHRVWAMAGMMAALFAGMGAAILLGMHAWVEAAVVCSLPVFLGLQWIKGAARSAMVLAVMGLFMVAHGWAHGMVLPSINSGFVMGVLLSSLVVMAMSVRLARVIAERPVKAHA